MYSIVAELVLGLGGDVALNDCQTSVLSLRSIPSVIPTAGPILLLLTSANGFVYSTLHMVDTTAMCGCVVIDWVSLT